MEWKELVELVIERDKVCQRCSKSNSPLTAHHIIPRNDGGINELSNLIALCSPCHDWVEITEGFESRLRTRSGIMDSWPLLNPVPTVVYESVGDRGDLRTQAGYPMPHHHADIWLMWVKNKRKGAKELFEKYGGVSPSERKNH